MKGFQKGNKYGRGGKREGAGAKKQSEIEVRKQATEIARQYIEAHVSPVLETYGQLAAGRWVEHYNEKTGAVLYKDFQADPPTTRHFIDKVLPEIKPDAANRPIAIQIIIESAGAKAVEAHGPRDSGPVLTIGS